MCGGADKIFFRGDLFIGFKTFKNSFENLRAKVRKEFFAQSFPEYSAL
jgi:hypothetical protein